MELQFLVFLAQAAMEVLRQMEGSSNSKATSLKIKRLYRILHRKQPNAVHTKFLPSL
jgi:hypothetical protein